MMHSHSINFFKAILGGILGTIGMTLFGLWFPPLMGMPPMNPAQLLAQNMGNNLVLGWIGHFALGIILALIYAAIQRYLPGPSAIRGAIYSVAPWLLVQLTMPMMGGPLFMGSVKRSIGSLIAHIIYGLILGAVYGGTREKHPLQPTDKHPLQK